MITEVIHQPPSWKVWSASSQGREFLKTKHTQNYTGLFIYFLLRPFFLFFLHLEDLKSGQRCLNQPLRLKFILKPKSTCAIRYILFTFEKKNYIRVKMSKSCSSSEGHFIVDAI